jgi:hypothetical protein
MKSITIASSRSAADFPFATLSDSAALRTAPPTRPETSLTPAISDLPAFGHCARLVAAHRQPASQQRAEGNRKSARPLFQALTSHSARLGALIHRLQRNHFSPRWVRTTPGAEKAHRSRPDQSPHPPQKAAGPTTRAPVTPSGPPQPPPTLPEAYTCRPRKSPK